jgi:hypothetical protein
MSSQIAQRGHARAHRVRVRAEAEADLAHGRAALLGVGVLKSHLDLPSLYFISDYLYKI